MREEKHLEILKEVEKTIKEALEAESLLSHQRRAISMLSLGVQQLVELHLHHLRVIRPGTQVKHEWFGMGERNCSIKLSSILTTDVNKIPGIREILALARIVEADRNDLLYGSPLANEKSLREKIDAFLEIKKSWRSVDRNLELK
ncbi:MAG: hypothetical protein ISS93_03865, partial [Candidatus Aenigmarchaeota archaeon]|nr:hypothetical protein [Candidatus Aenigmarchaeota archaeon]